MNKIVQTVLFGFLFLLAACNQSGSSPQATTDAQKITDDKDHRHSLITAEPGLPKVDIPAPLRVKNDPVPVKTGVQRLAAGDQVQLRFLIVSTDENDFGLATYKAVLERVGAPYDVLLAQNTPLTSSTLIGSDGVGKYNAILLTNNSLFYLSSDGVLQSAFDSNEWNTLWDYERSYKVRQVSLYTSYGTFPEDYCLRAVSDGGVGATPINATLTNAGSQIFTELKNRVAIPISNSYVYRTQVAAGAACAGASATAILNAGTDVLGVTSTTADGRERLALTFTSNTNLLQATLLTYGLIRWASKGLYLGEYKHYLNVDVDDWYNGSAERNPDGSFVNGGYRMNVQDALGAYQAQTNLVSQYSRVLPEFFLNLAYNAGRANLTAPPFGSSPENCNTNLSSPDPLTSVTYCLANDFRFINHTLTHAKLNDSTTATTAVARKEIRDNFNLGRDQLSLWVTNRAVLKTGEYTGLGVYNSDPTDTINPPDINDIMRSNPNLLSEAKAFGIKYLHGNMSFTAHQPSCFNCGKYHPMETSLLIVPDWPTNIAYFATNPAEEEGIYNCLFGPNGTCANGALRFWPQDQTYSQIIENESTFVFQQHVATGSVYSHTLHVGNLRQYASGKSLVFDLIDRTIAKYATYYKVPLGNPNWPDLGQYVAWRTSHSATLPTAKAVWDRAANTVTVTAGAAGTLFLSGAINASVPNENYGGTNISRLTLGANVPQTFTPAN